MGGLIFGVGMVLTRGCANRLLVLSGHWQPACVAVGLILPWWHRPLWAEPCRRCACLSAAGGRWMAVLRVICWPGLVSGMWAACCLVAMWLVAGVYFAVRNRWSKPASGSRPCSQSLTVALAWWFSFAVASSSFEVVNVGGFDLQQSVN